MNKSTVGAYVASQTQNRHDRITTVYPESLGPTITISHQTGAGTHEIAEQLAQILRKTEYKGARPWAVFDQQLVEKALEENRWPKELAGKITEYKRLFIDELMDDLFNLRPPSWVLVPQVVETMLRLAMEGHAILVGHGATMVTAKLPNAFHVRLTGSLARRIERVQKLRNLTPADAATFIRKEDRGREKYIKAHFHARLENELLYDMVINPDRVFIGDAVAIIAGAAQRFFSGL